MTDQEINIAVAQACPRLGFWKDHEGCWHFPGGNRCRRSSLCHDLNAMHEAEKTLSREQLDLYADALLSLIHEVDAGYFTKINWGHAVEFIAATARQRAEAFLRSLHKWQEKGTP